MNILIIGLHFSGKTTQAKCIATAYGIPYVSVGETLREEAESSSELGKQISELVESGKPLRDDLVFSVVRARLSRGDTNSGFVLDGGIYNAEQARLLISITAELNKKLTHVINITLDESVIVSRFLESYKSETRSLPPIGEEIVSGRLDAIREGYEALVKYFSGHGILQSVDGSGSISEVASQIMAVTNSTVSPIS